jgi:hypothetical protein
MQVAHVSYNRHLFRKIGSEHADHLWGAVYPRYASALLD